MKFEVFKMLEETATDYRAVLLAIRTANREAEDVIASVKFRLTSERLQAAARAAELTAQIDDPTRSETIKRMARAELESLVQHVYRPTDAESAAFNAALAELEQATGDARALQTRLYNLLKEAQGELEEIRKSTIHDPTNSLDIYAGYPAGLRRDFAAMLSSVCGEAAALVKRYGLD